MYVIVLNLALHFIPFFNANLPFLVHIHFVDFI